MLCLREEKISKPVLPLSLGKTHFSNAEDFA